MAFSSAIVLLVVFFIVASKPTVDGITVSPVSLSLVGSSVNSSTHFWFPQSVASYENGRVIVTSIQLEDDSKSCRYPKCSGCHKLLPCKKDMHHKTYLSFDYGNNWSQAVLPQNFGVAFGGVMLNSMEYMKIGAAERTLSNGSIQFRAPGTKLFLSNGSQFSLANASHDIVFDGFPSSFSSNITQLTRWCGVFQKRDRNMIEIVQTEMPANSSLGRSLVLSSSNDNFTFTYNGFIASHNSQQFKNYSNGPCESAVIEVFVKGMSDSVLLAVFRVDSFEDYYMSISKDDGSTWDTPTQLPNNMGSVRPKMEIFYVEEQPVIILSGGRPGLMLWISVPTADKGVISWHWMSFNTALAHNSLIKQQEMDINLMYSSAWANRTIFQNFSLHESTAYTRLIPQPTLGSNNSMRFVLLYDRLAQGWEGPPGVTLSDDHVFSMHFDVTLH
eukprot:m.33424 g.33424  ORF g.33424 m.33424 type:complete len:443 (+) comp8536_c0_seq2:143-1471(+)